MIEQLPAKKYDIIYADPPWGYANKGTRAAAVKHYDTMTLKEIKEMPVSVAGGVLLRRIVPSLCGRPSLCCRRRCK